MKKSKRNTSFRRSEDYLYSEDISKKQYLCGEIEKASLKKLLVQHREYLLDLLFSLDGVIQSPEYHPESDALYHSLQVFELAYQKSSDPELWLAALFHDVGKAVDSKRHAEIGGEMLSNLFPARVVWLIEHHLDLIRSPRKTKHQLANTQRLNDLTQLRAWDVAGRCPMAGVCSPKEALDLIIMALN